MPSLNVIGIRYIQEVSFRGRALIKYLSFIGDDGKFK